MPAEKKALSIPPASAHPRAKLFGLVETLLRSLGQVMFQESARSGALFFAALFFASPLVAWAAVVGALSSTLAGRALGADEEQASAGLLGFNGSLVGVSLAVFLTPTPAFWPYLVVASASSSLLAGALGNVWKRWSGSALTSPFVLTAWVFLLAASGVSGLSTTGLPAAGFSAVAAPPQAPTLAALVEGVLTGVSQVFLVNDAVSGSLVVAGLAVSSRRAAAMAVLGSVVGVLVGLSLGASESQLRQGLWGFNPCLTALALGATTVAAGKRWSAASVVFGAAATAVVAVAMGQAMRPAGMVAFTAPFVVVVWAFTLHGASFSKRPDGNEPR